jgi:hypothetical protein
VRVLRKVRELAAVEAFDAEVAAHEIRRLADNRFEFGFEVLDLVEAEPGSIRGSKRPAMDFVADLRRGQIASADELLEELGILMRSLSTISSITSSISAIRLQRAVIGLAAASIGVAIWAAAQAHR